MMSNETHARIGIIALIVVIGLFFAACHHGNDPSGGGTAPTITTGALPDGAVGTEYNQTLTATGDKPIKWSLDSGDLPAGVDLAASGLISGTPMEEDTFTFTVKATNATGNNKKSLSITITGGGGTAPAITTEALPDGTVGTEYNQTLTATGDTPITWSLDSGDLPDDLTLDKDGTITGTPSVADTFTFTVKATNATGNNKKSLLITITGGGGGGITPAITTEALPDGTVGTEYNQTLTATGDKPITWSLDRGDLPTGLTLAEATGVISGSPTTAGISTFTVKATNTAGNGTRGLTIIVGTAPAITTATLPDGTVGTAYNQTLTATGDTPITWVLDSGALPAGLELAGTTGVISGAPTTAGTSTFIVKATNATGNDTKLLSITITGGGGGGTAPAITTDSLLGGTVGTPYSQTLTATGDKPIIWSLDSGDLPDDLTLDKDGTITGTPSVAGAFTFTVKATNAAGNGTRGLSIIIGTAPAITTDSLPNGTVGTAYNQTLTATGDSSIKWSLDSGTLPAGLRLAETTGVISGTPTTAGTSTFTVKATNAAGSSTRVLTIIIRIAPTITTDSLPNGTVGTAYNQTLTATGDSPITWSLESGTLPTGINLFGSGVISGTPTTAGTSTFTVKAINAAGSSTRVLTILMRTAPAITTATLPDGTVGTAYSQTLTATGDTPITWSLESGDLPAGLTLAGATGVISGTPTTAGTSTFTVKATNAAGSSTRVLTIIMRTAPTITTATLLDGLVGTAYNQTLTATGDTPISWSLESGALPAGLTFAGGETAVISGTPTAANTSTFTVKATNAVGNGTKQLSITIHVEIEMVRIQGNQFTMGSPSSETERNTDETQHQVTLAGFKMGKYPVTQAQYEAVMGSNPSAHRVGGSRASYLDGITDTKKFPVEMASWYDAIVFCNKLSVNAGFDPAYRINGSTDPADWGPVPTSKNATWDAVIIVAGSDGYRLPTEAQWENACRAGTTTPFSTGNNITTAQANYDGNYPYNNNVKGVYRGRTSPVVSFTSNAWGLYDMHGNVFEWCGDWYGSYGSGSQTNPPGASSGNYRVRRGGSWDASGLALRSAFRFQDDPSKRDSHIGFRLVQPLTD